MRLHIFCPPVFTFTFEYQSSHLTLATIKLAREKKILIMNLFIMDHRPF